MGLKMVRQAVILVKPRQTALFWRPLPEALGPSQPVEKHAPVAGGIQYPMNIGAGNLAALRAAAIQPGSFLAGLTNLQEMFPWFSQKGTPAHVDFITLHTLPRIMMALAISLSLSLHFNGTRYILDTHNE